MKINALFGMAAIVLGTLVALIAFFLSDEFNRRALLDGEGFVVAGTRFGITVGMDRAEAARVMEDRGLRLQSTETTVDGRCFGRPQPGDQTIERWEDRGWRRGTICVASENGRVLSVEWLYTLVDV